MIQMRILVVDADHAFRDSLVNLLLACGVERFEMAASIDEAREEVAAVVFDMVLVDLFMPGMAGLAFAMEVRQQRPETKVILLIADDQVAAVNGGNGPADLSFPTILKSFIGRILPQLLFDETTS
jgi:CheY-like chemotaxis protein